MPRGNKRYFSTRPMTKSTQEHKSNKLETNPFRVDNISETSGDSISLSEKPSTSKQAVQYPTRTFENRNALEAFKTGFWKKPDKEHDAAANAKKKTQRKQSKRSYVNFNAFNYSDPEDYADADGYSNGPTMRYVDVARSALCSRSSPTPVQKTQQRAPNLDLHEFPYLKSNKMKNADANEMQNEHICCTDVNDMFEIEEIDEFHNTINGLHEQENEAQDGMDVAVDFDDDDDRLEHDVNQPTHEQLHDEDVEEEEEQLVHPLAFQSLSPYPSSSFVYINPNMGNNFDYIEPTCGGMKTQTKSEKLNLDFSGTDLTLSQQLAPSTAQPPLSTPVHLTAPSAALNKPSFIEKFSLLENESEYETTSNFGYGGGDYAASSDSCTIQHSETTSEYTEAPSSDGLLRDDANSAASGGRGGGGGGGGNGGHCPLNYEWLEMMVQQLSGPFDVVIPNFNFLEAHRDFPRFERQFEDNNYLRLEERAIFGLRIAENKGFFKDGPYM